MLRSKTARSSCGPSPSRSAAASATAALAAATPDLLVPISNTARPAAAPWRSDPAGAGRHPQRLTGQEM